MVSSLLGGAAMEEGEGIDNDWAVYAMATSCVGPWDGTGRTVRGQETLSMPSANDAFMSLT
jgi:hypothetical protein